MSKVNTMQDREAIMTLHRAGHSNCSIVDLLKDNGMTYKTVYNVIKWYKESGSTADWPHSGWPRTSMTPAAIKRTWEKVCQNSVCSMNKMAKEEGVSYSTMFRICQEEGVHRVQQVNHSLHEC